MEKVKRNRSANFSLRERDILVSLVQKYRTVLENKQSGASSWKKKKAAWESIQSKFNARSGIFRSSKTLKIKYEGLKRTIRKKSAAIRSELHRTGGGRNTAPPLDNVEEQVEAMITSSTDGLESINDSVILPQTQESQANVPKKTLFDELTQAKLELVKLQKEFLEAEMIEKKKCGSLKKINARRSCEFKVNQRKKELEFKENQRKKESELWEFEENERRKESKFKEKERKWKEEEYKLKLEKKF